MWKLSLIIFLISSLSCDEYDFDMTSIEKKPYEYSGYLRADNKAQRLNNYIKDFQNYLHLEGFLDLSYNYDIFKFKTSLITTQDYIESKLSENNLQANELYVEAKLTTKHTLLLGKESLGWGKGYFFNPVAFLDRVKDPSEPTQSREGFVLAKYSYNKSFNSELKNLSFDFVYHPSTKDINKDYAMRLYLLLYDTDIDFIYNYSNEENNKIGIDFSKNIQTNFEIHGEYAKVQNAGYSYLLGLRYLTDFDLTIISEYLYKSEGLSKDEIELSTSLLPFIAKDYAITLITQKEPFECLYSSIYYKNILNRQDMSSQNKFGVTYAFKNNINTDLSYNINSGTNFSEFGKKQVKDLGADGFFSKPFKSADLLIKIKKLIGE